MRLTRHHVYQLIDGERDYQDVRWNATTTATAGQHDPEAWIVYCEDYLAEAKHILARQPAHIANPAACEIFRKVAAMLVCAMEQHGAPARRREDVWQG